MGVHFYWKIEYGAVVKHSSKLHTRIKSFQQKYRTCMYQPMLIKWPRGLHQVSAHNCNSQQQQNPIAFLSDSWHLNGIWKECIAVLRWRTWHNFYLVPSMYQTHIHALYILRIIYCAHTLYMPNNLKSACHYQFELWYTFWQPKFLQLVIFVFMHENTFVVL